MALRDLALSLTDEETGEIVKTKGTRQGLCGLPVTETDLTKSIPVCHSKISVFEWSTDLVVRNNSHKKWWTMRIVQSFPWAVVSPSVHRILAHKWEVVQLTMGLA